MKPRLAARAGAAAAAFLVLHAAAAGAAGALEGRRLTVSADRMAVDNTTGDAVATGGVKAAIGPFRLMSESVARTGGEYRFGPGTTATTCTNAAGCLHWSCSGDVTVRDGSGEEDGDACREAIIRSATLRLFEVPVFWFPYWWQPLDTDYGWRVVPGYRSRWGAFLLTKYVYTLAGDMHEGSFGLAGSTRFDLRTKNGVAAGQGVRWNLGDFGTGKFKAYYAWDRDADRYDKHWNSTGKRHYSNWTSKVPDERYGLMLEHRWEPGERDALRLRGSYFSDSRFKRDFLRDAKFASANRFPDASRNELAWEHRENLFGLGVSVSGPLNDFYGGVSRLPELYLDAAPQPVPFLPANYESQNRIGWLNRDYAKHGDRRTATPFRYDPGKWADYQAFRADTYHRLTVPFRLFDTVSAVPRAGVRGTFWSDSSRENVTGYGKARSLDDSVVRSIAEGGITFSARGVATDFEGGWLHAVEPYADFLAQEARYSGLRHDARALVFDSIDGSADWLDQFAGRSRNLPYSWYGMTPGLRNVLRRNAGERGWRTVLDLDFYAAVQFNDTEWTEGNRRHRLSRTQEKPNYGRDGRPMVSPGVRAKWHLSEDTSFLSRVEWDGENDTVAYADVALKSALSKALSATLSYSARDQRWWDFSSTPYDQEVERNDDFNWAKFSYAGVSLEHELCDSIAWGPFVRWDLRENELDETGAWIDYRTDCLGFRLGVSYENDYRRIDGSKHDDDWRVTFGVYLRALGPGMASLW